MRCDSFKLVGVPLTTILLGCSSLWAEVSNDQLLAEIRSMRSAYESRISALESQLQEVREYTDGQRRMGAAQRSLDRALGEKSPLSTGALQAQTPETGARLPVQGVSQITLGGYTEFTYSDRGESTTQFDQVRTVLNIGARIHERINFYSEWEWEHGGVIVGAEEGQGEWELEQAYLDFQFHDAINFRAGSILVPVGRYNLYHESFLNQLVDRPLVDRWIIPTTWTEEGLGLHGQAYDGDSLGISYEAYLFNPGRADGIQHEEGFRGVRNEANAPVYDSTKAGAFRVAFQPARSAHWFADQLEIGISGYLSGFQGVRDEDGNKFGHDGQIQIWALDATYEKSFASQGTLGLRGEAALAHAGSRGRINEELDPPAGEVLPGQQGWGYYVEGYWQFWPQFLTQSSFGRGFKDPKLALSARYDWVDLAQDSFDQRDMGRVTVGLSYRPMPRMIYKLDYQIDHSPSRRKGTTLPDSGRGQDTDAVLFGVSAGF